MKAYGKLEPFGVVSDTKPGTKDDLEAVTMLGGGLRGRGRRGGDGAPRPIGLRPRVHRCRSAVPRRVGRTRPPPVPPPGAPARSLAARPAPSCCAPPPLSRPAVGRTRDARGAKSPRTAPWLICAPQTRARARVAGRSGRFWERGLGGARCLLRHGSRHGAMCSACSLSPALSSTQGLCRAEPAVACCACATPARPRAHPSHYTNCTRRPHRGTSAPPPPPPRPPPPRRALGASDSEAELNFDHLLLLLAAPLARRLPRGSHRL